MENILERFKKLTPKQRIIIAVLASIIVIILFVFTYKIFYQEDEVEELKGTDINEMFENDTDENNEKESRIGIIESKKTVTVHVVGEVNTPGVVTLNEGARIIDAINAAGGRTEEADLSKINLAYVIEDGVQIIIPSIKDATNASNNEETAYEGDSTYTKEDNSYKNGQNAYIRADAGEEVISSGSSQESNADKDVKVNINTANLEKLQTLPGIGQSTAQKIIEYRNQNGKFKNEEDLKNVSGIGESKFNNLKDKIIAK